ncbi:MAG TPA: hypothetical protein VGR62_01445 [Candidatus Binatia bacterium]|jgi:hypothetical protein|nr:hypothetical protein [Candidatus Binatia bacterium]
MRRAVVAAVLSMSLTASAEAPPPLSSADRPTRIDSTYGSGSFGSWHVDRFGLPAFRYDVDQRTDPRARQPELADATSAQHQVGNDHIVAAAFNDGHVQLWSQARLSQWANRWDEASRHFAGGFGYLRVDGTVASTLYLDRPIDVVVERDFGVGYFRKTMVVHGVSVEQIVYAPFGDDPLLLDDVTLTNTTAEAKTVSWFEYWDVAPYDQPGVIERGVGQPTWNDDTLVATQSGGAVDDPNPLALFAAVLEGPVDGYETSVAEFFGDGTRAAPAAVVADRLGDSLAPATPAGTTSGTLFAFRAPVTLAPGASVTLRYAYGMANPDDVRALVAKHRNDAGGLATSAAQWAAWLPKADFGARHRWVARELMWDAYLLRSATVWEEACGNHTITQGGYYQYASGLNLGTRSWLHYLLPIVYTEPALAREILRYAISLQREHGGQLPYGTGPLCTVAELGVSNDLDVWLLLAAVEYGLGSRDAAFFDEVLPFYDTGRRVTVWEHLQRAVEHQETYRGLHGGYLSGTNGDWADFSSTFLQMTESTLVTAQLAYVYPRMAELAAWRGDDAFTTTLRRRGAELLEATRTEWTGDGWYSRGYAGDRQLGAGAIFGEPQPWAVLAGAPDRRQARRLVRNIRRFLGGVDAPPQVKGPSRVGSSLTPASNDPEVTERSQPPGGIGDNNANYVGGQWFDVNGWLTWALGELDGVVPQARRYAWDEYTRNTLAAHATAFPDHWAGTISIDDACHAYYATHPERCGIGLYTTYDGQITEQPTWMVMDAIRLVGITPTRRGFRIAPHLPFRHFSLRLPQVGIASDARVLRGYVRPQQSSRIELRVERPRGAAATALRTWAGGRAVPHRLDDGFVVFAVKARRGRAGDWAITW